MVFAKNSGIVVAVAIKVDALNKIRKLIKFVISFRYRQKYLRHPEIDKEKEDTLISIIAVTFDMKDKDNELNMICILFLSGT